MKKRTSFVWAAAFGLAVAGGAYARNDRHEAEPSRRLGCNESVTVPIGERHDSASVYIDYERRLKIGNTNRTEVYKAVLDLTMKNGGAGGIDVSVQYDTNKKATHEHIPAKGHGDDLFPGRPQDVPVFSGSKQHHDSLIVSVDPTFHHRGSGIIELGTMCTGRLFTHEIGTQH